MNLVSKKVATDEKPNLWMLTVSTEEEDIQSAAGTLPSVVHH